MYEEDHSWDRVHKWLKALGWELALSIEGTARTPMSLELG